MGFIKQRTRFYPLSILVGFI